MAEPFARRRSVLAVFPEGFVCVAGKAAARPGERARLAGRYAGGHTRRDTEVRVLCRQTPALRQAVRSLSCGKLDVHAESCGCLAAYLRNSIGMLKGIEKAIREPARREDELEFSRLAELAIPLERIGKTCRKRTGLPTSTRASP